MIELIARSGHSLYVESEEQAAFWQSVGYRLKPEEKKPTKAPAKRSASSKSSSK